MHTRMILVGLAACAPASRPVAPAVPAEDPPAPSTFAIAEPPRPAATPTEKDASRDDMIITFEGHPITHRRIAASSAAAPFEKRSDLWDPCVRELVQSRPAEIREQLGDALTQAMSTCVPDSHDVAFEPPRAGRAYATGSHVGIAGVLGPTSTDLVLRVIARGPAPDRLTILAGGTRWTSPTLDVTHDAVWSRELAAIPYTKSLARVVRRMLDTDGALLRFESAEGIEDVPVTEELANDLRVMMDAVEEL